MRMMFTALALGALVACPANAAQIRFQGGWFVTGVNGTASGQCDDYDPTGDRGVARFREPVAGTDNGSQSFLTLYSVSNLKGYRKEGKFSTDYKPVETIYTGDNWGEDDSGGEAQPPQLRIKSLDRRPTATKTTAETEFIDLVVQIKNYDFMVGCVVTVKAALIQRPD